MKSPFELSQKLARQWQNAELREQRLLNPESWPIKLKIGKPTGKMLVEKLDLVREHLNRWRKVSTGNVKWQSERYRSTNEPVELPIEWQLNTPTEWVLATGNPDIRREYQILERLVSKTDQLFHRFLIRKRHFVIDKKESEIVTAAELVQFLEPGCAKGKPLRALSFERIDSKFFERNRSLIVHLLDIRFDGQTSDLGLESFLDAQDENNHWLLLVDLDGNLLPYAQLRIRASEFMKAAPPAEHLLIIENENCLHQLPKVKDTVAILGAGLNLSWMAAPWLRSKSIAYWGDIDSWGLTMLARARRFQPELTPILMTKAVFFKYEQSTVPEPHPASPTPPEGLTEEENHLYNQLLQMEKGRLEQEFLNEKLVAQTITEWVLDS